ncbi:glucosamine-6-phosphate deaminase [Peribacillus frigoritolerans]|uniref:glucosamine-6-phosphate deaminase n=1 Tax=Peribacillus frigoritolerans TaxID=450367 RepID=UPI0010593B3A|nr:glucosamine-6-phosphate deaminase [Peribacillus frigoritolerans]TDL82898.1 glucosamine-6-phosphate deaminase [Peribacillus frigoritolerans]
MKLLEAKDHIEMSRLAADIILEQIRAKSNAVLGLATEGTVLKTYQELILNHKVHGTSFAQVRTFNLDEYVGLSKNHENSYHAYMKKHLFDEINIQSSNTNLPNGEAKDLEKECISYESMIHKMGGIDLQLLGIGQNGHIGFNEPGTSFNSKTQIIELEKSTRIANSRYFNSLDEVPTHAVTMGISTIMQSKKVLLLASGLQKASILYELFNSEVTDVIPATILKEHPNVIIIADQEALSKLHQVKGNVYAK